MDELKDCQQEETGQAASSLMLDVDKIHVCISESSQLESLFIGHLLYYMAVSLLTCPEISAVHWLFSWPLARTHTHGLYMSSLLISNNK